MNHLVEKRLWKAKVQFNCAEMWLCAGFFFSHEAAT